MSDNDNNNNNETMKLIEDEVEALNITTERRFADKETFTGRGNGSDATHSSQRLFTPVIEPSANLLVAENAESGTTITTTNNNNNRPLVSNQYFQQQQHPLQEQQQQLPQYSPRQDNKHRNRDR